jgi:protein-S-isoprenylcysteine O-methyltransferase Ste14
MSLRARAFQAFLALAGLFAVFFSAAGTVRLWQAWFVLIAALILGSVTRFLWGKGGEARKAKRKGPSAPDWDIAIVGLYGAFLALLFLTAGLDVRFHWTLGLPPFLYGAAYAFDFAGGLLFFWALWINPFFEPVARLQEEKGQEVVRTGPYRFARHPGYSGMALIWLGMPLSLGSLRALGPALVCVILLAVRTVLEDRMLKNGLPGYLGYSGRVTDRWLPGIW